MILTSQLDLIAAVQRVIQEQGIDMTRPNDIPQDIWDTSKRMAGEYVDWLDAGNSTGSLSEHAEIAMADTIARAIMAERSRCLAIVREHRANGSRDMLSIEHVIASGETL